MIKTPEQWLEEAAPETKEPIFKLFLGYAPGVGKTYNMLSEGIRRASRGEDVVIGVVETHGRKGVAELAARLDHVPRRKLNYKGASFEEMDVDAIIARKPQVAVVDELAHTNIDGSKNRKRYDDVFELLKEGIDVLSTVNVQHVESLTPLVQQITGIPVRETIPDWVMQRVNEIVLVDLTPEALQKRKFFSPREPNVAARIGSGTSHSRGRPEPRIVPGKGRRRAADGSRKYRCLHEFQPCSAVFDRASRPNGAAH
jgi:two-component system sensor histidine kinase KdpD